MSADSEITYCACSPDGIATLHQMLLPRSDENDDAAWGAHESICVGGNRWALSVVEIKTAVSRRTLHPLLNEVSCEPNLD